MQHKYADKLEVASKLIEKSQLSFDKSLDVCRVVASSHFIADVFQQKLSIIESLINEKALLKTRSYEDFIAPFKALMSLDDNKYMAAIRLMRTKEMVRIAWRAISQLATLRETLNELSTFADACINQTIEYLSLNLNEKYGEPIDKEGRKQSLVVVALGKLGGEELNFSSDIDLFFSYPEENTIEHDGGTTLCSRYFTELAQKLIKMLSHTTADGYVFRVDLRLRPEGQSGPLVMSFNALETYYQDQGRDWERYALMKARIVNRASIFAKELNDILDPFVYRRYVDFSILETLRSLQQIIAREVKLKSLKQDIKRGPGGIREIEFVCQSLQLMRGGRDIKLRQKRAFKAMEVLVARQHLTEKKGTELKEAYAFLRRLENALQMFNDKQTHALPSAAEEQDCIAYQLHFDDWGALIKVLAAHRHKVQTQFSELIEQTQSLYYDDKKLLLNQLTALFQGALGTIPSEDLLFSLGFSEPQDKLKILRELRESKRCKRLSQIARLRLDKFVPMLLVELQKFDEIDVLFLRVLNLLEGIVQRSAYLALLTENPQSLQHLLRLFSLSSWVALTVSEQPFLLEELLDTHSLYTPLSEALLDEMLKEGLGNLDDFEQEMEILRQFKLRQTMKVASANITDSLSSYEACVHLSRTGEVILKHVLSIAVAEMEEKYPQMKGKELQFAIIAYGKLGSRELSYLSDFDLVFLHRYAPNEEYFVTRLTQRILHILGTRMMGGVLYSVDTRLRPSGSAGLLVSHVDAFCDYQKNSAWTWEHQALIRARFIAGNEAFRPAFDDLRLAILSRERDSDELKKDIAEMRHKMRDNANLDERFHLKQGHGGLIDVEFLVQFAVLNWANKHQDLCVSTTTADIINKLIEYDILNESTGRALSRLYLKLIDVIHHRVLKHESLEVDADCLSKEREIVSQLCHQWQLSDF